MSRTVAVDLTAVRPNGSGGVEGVATGITRSMLDLHPDVVIVVGFSDRDQWAERLGTDPEALTVIRGSGGRRMRKLAQTASEYRVSRRLRSSISSAVARRRATAASQGEIPTWYPFHRSPAVAGASVVTLHDLRVFQRGLEEPASQATITANVRHARALITSWLHPYRQAAELFPGIESKLFLVPLPILNPGEYRSRSYDTAAPLRALVPAGTSVHKNHELVLKALQFAPRVTVTFTGPADEPRLGYLRKLASDLGVASRVEWVGYVPGDRLQELYDRANVLVMPSRWEAASGPVFEAVSRGLPFIATDISPIRSQSAQFGLAGPLVDPDNPRELARALEDVRGSYERFAAANVEPAKALRRITWESTATQYLEILEWAAKGDSSTRPTFR